MGFNVNIHALIKRAKNLRFLGTASFSCLVLLSLLTVFPIVNHMDSAEAAYTPSTSTLAIVSSKETASVDVTPTSSTGTFVTSSTSDQAEFTVTTNNLTGYSLNILGTDVSGQLVNTNTGDILDTISSDTSESDFRNGSASLYSNKWGYRLNINNTTTTDFIAAPTTATSKTIYTTSSPNTTSDNYKLGIGARVDYTKPSGTYTNTFVLTAVGNPISYQINYDDTTSDTSVANIPTNEGANNIEASGFTLSSTIPTRTGYTFNKWCDGTVTHTNLGNSTCSGTQYAAGASYNFSSISGSSINTANLKAMWNVNTYKLTTTFAGTGVNSVTVRSGSCSGTSMGTISSSGGYVSNLVYNTTYYLCPSLTTRYSVRSWAKTSSYGTLSSTTATQPTFTMGPGDGAVTLTGVLWFQDATDADCGKTMYDNRGTAAYKNISYTTTRIGDLCYTTRNLDLPGGTTLTNSNSNLNGSLTSYTLPASDNSSTSFSDDTKAYVYNTNNTACAIGTPCYSYYSYIAATAGTNPSSGDATSDICPKGWRMPTMAEHFILRDTYSTGVALNALYNAPVHFGYYFDGSFTPKSSGYAGWYWSSTARSSTSASHLNFTPTATGENSIYISIGAEKRLGGGIRCVAKKTMQNFTSADAASMATGDTKTLTDSRDGNNYTVAKLPDGKVWMTKNLDLPGGTTLTNANSNLNGSLTSYTLPASETISSGTTLANASAFSDDNTAYVFNSGSTTCSSSSPCYSYYSYVAATAGTGNSSLTTGNAPSDICPKGWRLPTRAEYTTLENTYITPAAITAAPFRGVYSGGYFDRSFNSYGPSGYNWSSTTDGSLDAYLYTFMDGRGPDDYASGKASGIGVRCVAKT